MNLLFSPPQIWFELFGWFACGSEKSFFKRLSKYFCIWLLTPIFHVKKRIANHLKKIESSSHKDLCGKDFKCCKFILLFCYLYMYLPLEKDKAVHFNKSKSPSTKDAFELSFDENVLERILNVPFLLFSPWIWSWPFIWNFHSRMQLKLDQLFWRGRWGWQQQTWTSFK